MMHMQACWKQSFEHIFFRQKSTCEYEKAYTDGG
jgi:hypothetical protein